MVGVVVESKARSLILGCAITSVCLQVPDDILENVTAQIPQVKPVPRRLDEFTEEEKSKFPKVFEPPTELLVK